jgi:hypothetical protein
LKNIVSVEDWEVISDHIQYDFLYDNQFAEFKETEMLTNRLGLLTSIEQYVGKYYSTEYVRKKILRQTDSEIIEIDEQIQDEIEKGILPDPSKVDPITGQPLEGEEELPPEEMAPSPEEQEQAEADMVQAQKDEIKYAKDTKKAEI